jgi:hypothetical protein
VDSMLRRAYGGQARRRLKSQRLPGTLIQA